MKETWIRDAKTKLTSRTSQREFVFFLQGWCGEMIAKGIPFFSDEELEAPRDRTPGRVFSIDR